MEGNKEAVSSCQAWGPALHQTALLLHSCHSELHKHTCNMGTSLSLQMGKLRPGEVKRLSMQLVSDGAETRMQRS